MTEATAAPVEPVAETPQTAPVETPKAELATETVGNLMADAKAQNTENKGETEPAKEPEKPEEKKEESAEKEVAKPEPIEYKDLKIPEGIDSDALVLSKFVDIASKNGIPQETAETIIAELAPQIADALKAPYTEWNKLQTQWQSQVKDDPEIGGANHEATMNNIAKLRDARAIVRFEETIFDLMLAHRIPRSRAIDRIMKNEDAQDVEHLEYLLGLPFNYIKTLR